MTVHRTQLDDCYRKRIRKVIALYGTILIAGIQVMAFRMFVYDTL